MEKIVVSISESGSIGVELDESLDWVQIYGLMHLAKVSIDERFRLDQQKQQDKVQKTREDSIKEHYLRLQELSQDLGSNQIKDEHGAFLGQMTGILAVLSEYGIKIEGVNT